MVAATFLTLSIILVIGAYKMVTASLALEEALKLKTKLEAEVDAEKAIREVWDAQEAGAVKATEEKAEEKALRVEAEKVKEKNDIKTYTPEAEKKGKGATRAKVAEERAKAAEERGEGARELKAGESSW